MRRCGCHRAYTPGHVRRATAAGKPLAAQLEVPCSAAHHGCVVGLGHRVQQLKVKVAQQHAPDRLDLQVGKVLALQSRGGGGGGATGRMLGTAEGEGGC